MRFIDSHCHLYAEEFDADRQEVIERAKESGIEKLLLPNIDTYSLEPLYRLTNTFPELCLPMMGLHPCSVGKNYRTKLDKIEAELDTRPFIAIGEIGLDYYWDTTYKEEQKQAFREQIRWAKDRNLPIVIHTRNSFDDAMEIVREESMVEPIETNRQGLTGVFHCFSGSREDAAKIVDIGFMMGLGGVLTFKNSGVAEAIKDVPLDYLLLETDAPYLAPVPFRGKRNESAYMIRVAEKLAEIKGISVEEVAEITTANAKKLFKLA